MESHGESAMGASEVGAGPRAEKGSWNAAGLDPGAGAEVLE